jgi:hypothetical protein
MSESGPPPRISSSTGFSEHDPARIHQVVMPDHIETLESVLFLFSQAAAQGTSRRGSKVVRELPA